MVDADVPKIARERGSAALEEGHPDDDINSPNEPDGGDSDELTPDGVLGLDSVSDELVVRVNYEYDLAEHHHHSQRDIDRLSGYIVLRSA